MFLKYLAMWPHCSNIACFDSTDVSDAVDYCLSSPQCDGFSFTTNAFTGSGCYKKNCRPDDVKGYGVASHDYYEKIEMKMTMKYVDMWPHCTNLECFSSTYVTDAEDICLSDVDCDGFSFKANADHGSGCYKQKCIPDDVKGYGSVTHGYYEKIFSGHYQKYVAMWPHCTNINCFSSVTLAEAEDFCMSSPECDGFSFKHNSDIGTGCYKRDCHPDDVKDYGSSTHDYYEKFELSANTVFITWYVTMCCLDEADVEITPISIAHVLDIEKSAVSILSYRRRRMEVGRRRTSSEKDIIYLIKASFRMFYLLSNKVVISTIASEISSDLGVTISSIETTAVVYSTESPPTLEPTALPTSVAPTKSPTTMCISQHDDFKLDDVFNVLRQIEDDSCISGEQCQGASGFCIDLVCRCFE